jgi:D-3-phosphoglycerate dehydrogenase
MIIITAPVHSFLLTTLKDKGLDFDYAPGISYAELYDKIEWATGLIVSTRIEIDRKIIEKSKRLQWIGRLGSGMEIIDVDFARSRNIKCISSPEGNRTAVAEQALGMLLSLMHHIRKSADEVKEGKWLRNENRGLELSGKVVGIVGYGNTGSEFAGLLAPFNVQVLAVDKYKTGFSGSYVKESNLDEVCALSDVISFHLPLNKETQHYADAAFFKKLKRKPFIINTSRGKIVETGELIDALKNNLIRGAALDVLENEELSSYTDKEKEILQFLTNQNNVIVTPHIGGYSHEAFYKMSRILLEKLGIL